MRILLVVYDNDAYIHSFPMGTGYIAAVLEKAGHEVEIFSQDFHHYPNEYLTEYLDKNRFDVVGIGVIGGYYQYRRLLALSEAINRSKQRPFYMIGGFGPSPEPEYFLRKTGADVVVIGEGEVTVVELMEALAAKCPLHDINGIAFLDGNQAVITPRRALIQDLDTIPWPAHHLFPMHYYRLLRRAPARPGRHFMTVLSSRGCTFLCTFCYRMDKGMRLRGVESLIEEMKMLYTDYGVTYFDFADELFLSSVERGKAVCEAIIKSGMKDIVWVCQGRLNYAQSDLMPLMKKAGCIFVNYGIEAMDDEVLKLMKKGMRVDQVYEGIRTTKEAGIHPGYNIIFGNLGDNLETLEKGVEFLLEFDDGAQLRTIRPVTPYPGSPLYHHAIKEGLLKDCEDFYHHKHLNSDLLAVNFTDLTDDEFHEALRKANKRLVANYHDKRKALALEDVDNLYQNKNTQFRGFRQY